MIKPPWIIEAEQAAALAAKRRKRFEELKKRGWSNAKIGRQYRISRERVRQILSKGE